MKYSLWIGRYEPSHFAALWKGGGDMEQWQYRLLDHNRLNEDELNELGTEGYEVIACFPYETRDMGTRFIVLLRRPKPKE